MFSTSEKAPLGRLRRAVGKKQIPHDEAVRNDKAFCLSSKTARNSMGLPLGLENNVSNHADFGARYFASTSGRQKIEKRSCWRSLL
jgi:hypothetical protein